MTPTVSYRFDAATSGFTIENYAWAPPLSNFLPAIAGPWGIPLWAFYVSRGQLIASMGVHDKDGQITEFHSFHNACALVERHGFRTFLRLDGGASYEPFQRRADARIRQRMTISAGEVSITESNPVLGIEISVVYFPLVGLPVAGLVRDVRIRNLSRRARRIEWVDGLARLLPAGLDRTLIKFTPRHVEAMMGVHDVAGVPVFRLKQTAADVERVGRIEGGNFYLSLAGGDGGIVVDPEALFGDPFDIGAPWIFARGGSKAVLSEPQVRENKTPCAFTVRRDRFPPGGEVSLASIVGNAASDELLRDLTRRAGRSLLDAKRKENHLLLHSITEPAFTASGRAEFDAFCRQDFLDNVIRGGMPVVWKTLSGPSAFYLYARQNGDLERDYHFFVVEASYLSQGNGHYRSVLQNRRTDAWFFPEVGPANLLTFLNLVQLDGYNPLEVRTLSYRAADAGAARRFAARHLPAGRARKDVSEMLRTGFTPGGLVLRMEEIQPSLASRREEILREAMAISRENEVGGLHEGFWVDHWHYNLDTLEVYLMVYPDRLREVLLGPKTYTYFDDPDVILPRSETTVDAGAGRIRRYGSVARDAEKARRIAARERAGDPDAWRVRTRRGAGEVYRTTLLVKLLTILGNRLATLDPSGLGIEMEAGKPGWNDSMNGLPGLFGSGLSETLELLRALRLLVGAIDRLAPEGGVKSETVAVYEELAVFVRALRELIAARRRARDTPKAARRYWDAATTCKETYREATRPGVTGRETKMSLGEIRSFLSDGLALLDRIFTGASRRKVLSPGGVPHTYFVHEVSGHRPLGGKNPQGHPLVSARRFRRRAVRLFLEGAVHWMKARPEEAPAIYRAVRRSPLFDKKLRMYKSCEDMRGEDAELGRAVGAYPRGWIENESIYLHMEYKYLLEILRSGLAAEFWRDAETCLIPFLDPAVYGRSPLEGASFIVSSAYADTRLHGRAFQPRLSGITVEFLHAWILLTAGPEPFRVEDAGLVLSLSPSLPARLFTKAPARREVFEEGKTREIEIPADSFACRILGRVLVVYRNPRRRDTFGPRAARPVRYALLYRDGRRFRVDGPSLASPHAEAVRAGEVERIDVDLAAPGDPS